VAFRTTRHTTAPPLPPDGARTGSAPRTMPPTKRSACSASPGPTVPLNQPMWRGPGPASQGTSTDAVSLSSRCPLVHPGSPARPGAIARKGARAWHAPRRAAGVRGPVAEHGAGSASSCRQATPQAREVLVALRAAIDETNGALAAPLECEMHGPLRAQSSQQGKLLADAVDGKPPSENGGGTVATSSTLHSLVSHLLDRLPPAAAMCAGWSARSSTAPKAAATWRTRHSTAATEASSRNRRPSKSGDRSASVVTAARVPRAKGPVSV
jgi:hypothetical protein